MINEAFLIDDIYTFYATDKDVKIELGDIRCFETISDAERFEAKLSYSPYLLNGTPVIETRLNLISCHIKNIVSNSGIDDGPFTKCSGGSYRLTELTEDRMVFSVGATYIGKYTWAYVFEKVDE